MRHFYFLILKTNIIIPVFHNERNFIKKALEVKENVEKDL